MPSPFFSGRIPKTLHEQIEKHVAETGEPKSQILVNALSAYLKFPIVQPVGDETKQLLTQHEEKLAEHAQKLTQLEALIRQLILDKTDNNSDNNITDTTQAEIANITEPEIQADNKPDNIINAKQIELSVDNTTLSTDNMEIEPDKKKDNELDNRTRQEKKPSLVKRELIKGELVKSKVKTQDVPKLPGLEEIDSQKIKVKLNNTKNSKSQTTQIGPYIISLVPPSKTDSDAKIQKLLWDVYKSQ